MNRLTSPAAAVALYRQAWSVRMIARECHMKKHEVLALLKAGGIAIREVFVAGNLGSGGAPGNHIGLVGENDAKVRALRAAGKNDRQIAEVVGVSRQGVWNYRLKHNIQ